jgi:hypothetical protein
VTWIGLHAYEITWWRDERTRSRALGRPSQRHAPEDSAAPEPPPQ